MPSGFTSVNVNNNFIAAILLYIGETGFYRNPTEFVNSAVREKIEEIHSRQIDKRKLDAFFIRERQIRAMHTDHSTD
jgi:Arc/MetJ-type ribon-helix-helix transcriptional regulator